MYLVQMQKNNFFKNVLHITNRQMQPDFQTASYFCKEINKIFH